MKRQSGFTLIELIIVVIILGLLAAEMLAKTGVDPYQQYQALTKELGSPLYRRLDAPANAEQKMALKKLDVNSVTQTTLAGDAILAVLTKAPGNDADIGGVKVVTRNGWFAARPSGTENAYKIYLESFVGYRARAGYGPLRIREELAQRSGIAVDTLKRFEQTGQVSLERLLKVAVVLDAVHEFSRQA